MYFQIIKVKRGFYVRQCASNHKIYNHSEFYNRKRDALHAVKNIQREAGLAEIKYVNC